MSSNLINIQVNATSIFENGTSNLVYTFIRTGDLSSALSVNFAVGGIASYYRLLVQFISPILTWSSNGIDSTKFGLVGNPRQLSAVDYSVGLISANY